MLFDAQHAQLYDLVYTARGKDYRGEAAALHRLIRARKPDASALLDVACGTGEHLLHLRELFDHVEGIELAPAMLAIARRKLSGVTIHEADMSDFSLGRTFDVITCLYSSIAYLPLPQLRSAVASMARHLVPGGVIVMEPWWSPEQATYRAIAGDVIRGDGDLTIARVAHGVPRDGAHHLECHFLVADRDGIRHFTDTQVLRHFSRQEYLGALAAAGCGGDYVTGGVSGRGLVIGVRR